jgi:hypothetical protein
LPHRPGDVADRSAQQRLLPGIEPAISSGAKIRIDDFNPCSKRAFDDLEDLFEHAITL